MMKAAARPSFVTFMRLLRLMRSNRFCRSKFLLPEQAAVGVEIPLTSFSLITGLEGTPGAGQGLRPSERR